MAALLLAHGQSFTAEHAVSDAFELDREICRRLDREESDLEGREASFVTRLTGSPMLGRPYNDTAICPRDS